MPGNEPIVDPGAIDCERVLAGRDAIREWVPQRHEFEMLDGILHFDEKAMVGVALRRSRPPTSGCAATSPASRSSPAS